MAENEQDYRIAALRAAGYEEAARLLEALPGGSAPAEPAPAAPVEPLVPMAAVDAEEAARRANGEKLLAQLHHDTNGRYGIAGEVMG